jgi:regulator of protease activity HflC (stomatin/prohibitin superfamily)
MISRYLRMAAPFMWVVISFLLFELATVFINMQDTMFNVIGFMILPGVILTIVQFIRSMKNLFSVVILAVLFASCNRIDAGHVGIKVNLYGSDKGVSDVTEVTGMVWYNFFTTSVYEIPTFVQNAVYTHDGIDGSSENEEFRVTTKDGMVARFDLSMNYYTPAENVVKIFKKYRKPIEDLEKGVVRTYLREAFNNVASKYTAEQLYEQRAAFEKESEIRAIEILSKEGFVVEQVVILNEIRLPEDVTQRINDKVKAAQITKQKQEEVQQAIADGKKRIAKAQADSASMIINATAKAEAYRLQRQEITPMIIQNKMIEKWDGKLPVYGTVPTLFKDVVK